MPMENVLTVVWEALRQQGYCLEYEGFRLDGPEVPLICTRGDVIVGFVLQPEPPGLEEQRALSRTLLGYIRARRLSEIHVRWDLAWVEDGRARLTPNAFRFAPH
jgi:hypothetical protein